MCSSDLCGACINAGPGVSKTPDTVTISAINRNFPGRMGHKQAEVFLASPLTVAASALTGQITERRCGSYTLDFPVSASGDFSGDMKFIEDAQCGSATAQVKGNVGADSLSIEVRTSRIGAGGTLRRGP